MIDKGYFIGLLVGVVIAEGSSAIIGYGTNTRIVRISDLNKVQAEYVAPSKIESIVCEDLDSNGESETIMRIAGQSYLLREVNGKPVLSEYQIKPAEILLNEGER